MNRTSINFGFQFFGDGTSLSLEVDLKRGPVAFLTPSGGGALSGFDPAAIDSPTAFGVSVSGPSALTILSATVSRGVMTLSFSEAPNEGAAYDVGGALQF